MQPRLLKQLSQSVACKPCVLLVDVAESFIKPVTAVQGADRTHTDDDKAAACQHPATDLSAD